MSLKTFVQGRIPSWVQSFKAGASLAATFGGMSLMVYPIWSAAELLRHWKALSGAVLFKGLGLSVLHGILGFVGMLLVFFVLSAIAERLSPAPLKEQATDTPAVVIRESSILTVLLLLLVAGIEGLLIACIEVLFPVY